MSLSCQASAGWEHSIMQSQPHFFEPSSQSNYTLDYNKTVLVHDISQDHRFTPSSLVVSHDLLSSISAPLHGH